MANNSILMGTLCAVCLSLTSAAAVAGQSSAGQSSSRPSAGQSSGARRVSATLRAHVQEERFQPVTSIRGMPLGVRDELQALFGSTTLDIAEPGADFRSTADARRSSLPLRRLITAGCSADHCLVYYERGGTRHTWHIGLFHWTPAATRLDIGGPAPAGLATFDDVHRALLTGSFNSAGPW